MKKLTYINIYLSAFLFIVTVPSKHLSAQTFREGDNILAAGIGFGSAFGPGTYGSQSPALSLQYEHGNWSVGGPGVISLGGYLGYKSFSYNDVYYDYKWTYTIIGLRSAYHYNGLNSKDWDVYGGAMLSYNILSHSSSNPYYDRYYNYSSGLWLSLYIGGRYYVSPNVSLFGELGYGISYFTLGAAFRL